MARNFQFVFRIPDLFFFIFCSRRQLPFCATIKPYAPTILWFIKDKYSLRPFIDSSVFINTYDYNILHFILDLFLHINRDVGVESKNLNLISKKLIKVSGWNQKF